MGKSFLQRLHAKVYAASWGNPLFADPKVKERSLTRTRYVAYSLLVLVSTITFFSALFWFGTQDRFALVEVRTEGMRSIPNETLSLRALHKARTCTHLFAPCLYRWNIGRAEIVEMLQSSYELEYVSLLAQDHLITLQLREAVTMIPLRIGSQVWFATQTGVLKTEATAEDIAAGIIIPADVYQEIDVSVVVEQGSPEMQVLSAQMFQQILAYKRAFFERGIPIASFSLTDDAGKVMAHTQMGFAIFFTPWEDAERQIHRLTGVLSQATPQSYVDIRFGERIYVK